jgi:hypothetical protein
MTKHSENLLKSWYNKANNMELLHRKAFIYYSYNDALLTIPTIIITSLAASCSFISIGYTSNKFFNLSSGLLNIISIILTSIREYFSWKNKIYEHYKITNTYSKLKNLIEIQLSLHKSGLNIPYEKIITEIGSILTRIENESIPLPDFIVKKYLLNNINNIDYMIEINTNEKEITNEEENNILETITNIDNSFTHI